MTSDSTKAFMNFLNIVSSMLKTIKIVTKTELSFKTKKQLECVLAFYATIQYVKQCENTDAISNAQFKSLDEV